MNDYIDGQEMGWNSPIEDDGEERTLLEEGDYPFEVIKFERSRSQGKGRLPACNMAVLTLRVGSGSETTTVTDNLLLHSSLEWKLSQFFRSIGQKKHGEKLVPNWNNVVGARGRCRVYVDEFTGNDGTAKKNNKIRKYLDPDGSAPAAPAPAKSGFWG